MVWAVSSTNSRRVRSHATTKPRAVHTAGVSVGCRMVMVRANVTAATSLSLLKKEETKLASAQSVNLVFLVHGAKGSVLIMAAARILFSSAANYYAIALK